VLLPSRSFLPTCPTTNLQAAADTPAPFAGFDINQRHTPFPS